MTFQEVLDRIKEEYRIIKSSPEDTIDIMDVELADWNFGEFRSNVLYMGDLDSARNSCLFPDFLIFAEPDGYTDVQYLKYYAIVHKEDFAGVFNCIKNEMSKVLREKQIYAQMLKMILDGRNLSSILSKLAEQSRNPIAAIDISGKILGYSTPFEVKDPLWMNAVKKGYCPYGFMLHIKKVQANNRFPKSPETFFSRCEDMNLLYLCSQIFVQDNLVGYVFMFECNASIDRQSRELLPLISKMVSESLIRGQNDSSARNFMYKNLLLDMLTGIDREHARVRIQSSELSFPSHMRVFVIHPLYYMSEEYIKKDLQNKCRKLLGNILSVYYRGDLVVIIKTDESYRIDEDILDSLYGICEELHLQIGISNGFMQPSDFAYYYHQASAALKISNRRNDSESLQYYEKAAFFDFLDSVDKDTVVLKNYCHPALDKLREYDYEKGTELYDTLKVFTRNKFNQKLTTDELFIHRNTLNYRRQRIEELCNLDFENPDTLFLLLYSFQIDEYVMAHQRFS